MKVTPSSDTFLSNALLQCLRTWKERVGEAPLILTWEDIDQLYDWVDELHKKVATLRKCADEIELAAEPYERTLNED